MGGRKGGPVVRFLVTLGLLCLRPSQTTEGPMHGEARAESGAHDCCFRCGFAADGFRQQGANPQPSAPSACTGPSRAPSARRPCLACIAAPRHNAGAPCCGAAPARRRPAGRSPARSSWPTPPRPGWPPLVRPGGRPARRRRGLRRAGGGRECGGRRGEVRGAAGGVVWCGGGPGSSAARASAAPAEKGEGRREKPPSF